MHTLPANPMNGLTSSRQVYSQQAENSTDQDFEENKAFIAHYLRKASAWGYFKINRNTGLSTKEDYNPQIQPH